jgi:N-methylhydantoinase B/oxoprolinase/acetone carboxylase alpha subunit
MCLAALGEMMEGRNSGMAGSYSANSDIGIGGVDARSGEEFVLYMMPVGGIGARPTLDGESALINYMGNCSSQPVEVWESMYPLRVGEYRLRADSAGPGRRRGGLGLCVSYEALSDGIQVSVFTERQRFAPFGLQGGQPAATGSYTISRAETRLPIPTKTSGLWLQAGDVIEVATAGGGGYGDPFAREPELVAADVRDGLVSAAAAALEYGVILDDNGEPDLNATRQARQTDQRPIMRLTVDRIDEAASSLALSADKARSSGLEQGQVLFCFTDRNAVYVAAELQEQDEVVVPAMLAQTLRLAVGDTFSIRSLPSKWAAYSTSELRRRFSTN